MSFHAGTLHVKDKCPLTGQQTTLFCRAQWGRSHFLHTFGNLSVLFFKFYFIYFFLGAEPSIPILWELTQEEIR